jgi:hypothetical protein
LKKGYSKVVREIKCIKCNTAKPAIISGALLMGWPHTKLYTDHFDVPVIAFTGVFYVLDQQAVGRLLEKERDIAGNAPCS